jgi:hypothetical protein
MNSVAALKGRRAALTPFIRFAGVGTTSYRPKPSGSPLLFHGQDLSTGKHGMGLDDILQEKRDRAGAQRADHGESVREAQARRLALAQRVETELSNALKATGDPALSSPAVQKVMGAIGVSTAVQIDCHGRNGTTHFQASVRCEPGAEATCSAITVILPNRARGVFPPTKQQAFTAERGVRESQFEIDPAALHTFIQTLARRS